MQISLARKSVLAAGLLAVAAVFVVVKSQPMPAKSGGVDAAAPKHSQRSTTSRSLRIEKPPGRPVFSGDSTAEPQTFLPALEELAASNPKQALARMAVIQDADLHSLALGAVASGWAHVDLQGAVNWVTGLPASQRGDAEAGLISFWGSTAPADCLGWVEQHPPGILRDESLVKLAETWRSSDPQEALTRFLGMEIGEGSERGIHAIVSQWAMDDPPAAIENVSALDKSPRRDEFLQSALVSLSSQDPELAWKYSDRFSDPKYSEHVRGRALEVMAVTRPDDAIKLAGAGGNSETLLAGIARGWAATDDSAAMEWIDSLADADLASRLREAAAK